MIKDIGVSFYLFNTSMLYLSRPGSCLRLSSAFIPSLKAVSGQRDVRLFSDYSDHHVLPLSHEIVSLSVQDIVGLMCQVTRSRVPMISVADGFGCPCHCEII